LGILKLKQTFIEQSQLSKPCFKSRFKKGSAKLWDKPHSDAVKTTYLFAKQNCDVEKTISNARAFIVISTLSESAK